LRFNRYCRIIITIQWRIERNVVTVRVTGRVTGKGVLVTGRVIEGVIDGSLVGVGVVV